MQIYTHVTVQAQTQVCQLNMILSCQAQSYMYITALYTAF